MDDIQELQFKIWKTERELKAINFELRRLELRKERGKNG